MAWIIKGNALVTGIIGGIEFLKERDVIISYESSGCFYGNALTNKFGSFTKSCLTLHLGKGFTIVLFKKALKLAGAKV